MYQGVAIFVNSKNPLPVWLQKSFLLHLLLGIEQPDSGLSHDAQKLIFLNYKFHDPVDRCSWARYCLLENMVKTHSFLAFLNVILDQKAIG